MISNKSLRSFQELGAIGEERERARIRAEIADELDANLDQIRRERDAEEGRQHWAHSLRHATAAKRMAEPTPNRTPEETRQHRAQIRRGVEADVTRWESERKG